MGDTPAGMYGLVIAMSLLAIIATALRFHARFIKRNGISYDDYAILVALVFTIATGICIFVGALIGDLARHTGIDSDGYPIFTRRTQVFEQVVWVTYLTQTLTFGFTKISVLLFYRRIFQGRNVQIAIWAALGLMFVWTVGFFFSNLLQCLPFSVNWTNWGYAEGACFDTNMLFIAQAWSDVSTDVLILALPIPSIWGMQLPIRRKIAVCGMFLLGALTVAAGIAKLGIYYKVLSEINNASTVDVTYSQTPLVYWPMIESSIGIIGACLPLFRPLFKGSSSRGFARDLNSVDLPTTEQSDTVWEQSRPMPGKVGDDWNSQISTPKWGSESMPSSNDALNARGRGTPALPMSSLQMLNDSSSDFGEGKKKSNKWHAMV